MNGRGGIRRRTVHLLLRTRSSGIFFEDGRQKATDKVTAIATPTTPTTTTSKAASGEGVEKGPKDGSGSFDETKKTTTTANDDLPSDVVGKSSSSSSTTKATPTSTTTIN
jgi:hypothetical protein